MSNPRSYTMDDICLHAEMNTMEWLAYPSFKWNHDEYNDYFSPRSGHTLDDAVEYWWQVYVKTMQNAPMG